eukprot:6342205-Heterocapsa_arctica.AAC.1
MSNNSNPHLARNCAPDTSRTCSWKRSRWCLRPSGLVNGSPDAAAASRIAVVVDCLDRTPPALSGNKGSRRSSSAKSSPKSSFK